MGINVFKSWTWVVLWVNVSHAIFVICPIWTFYLAKKKIFCEKYWVMVAIIGMWSEGVIGPGLRSILLNTLLFVNTMSGEVEQLCLR